MERELFGDEDPMEYEAAPGENERAYEDLVERLREKGIYHEDAEKIVPMAGKKKRNIRKIHFGKVAGIALVCCACVFAASMTSEANREYFIKNVRYLVGDDTRILIDNDEENEIDSMEEAAAIQEIENKLGIDMPEFYYRPQGLEFYSYEVNTAADNARIEYMYHDIVIAFYINKENENTASNINSSHGMKKETIVSVSDKIKVTIEKIQDDQDELPSYTAQWEREEVLYHLSGKMEIDELEEMIENMVY
ncbi:MAG TPA: DUF4367 domain-containing protein [Candidatus Blautia faecipullorum]|nr:DUF4367 domain-containing protein [Candidatus Blautia faecipullorum]